MRDRYDFFYDYFDTEEKRYKKGEMKVNIGQYLRNAKSSNFKITSNYQYRPDKIAYTFYGDPTLSWVLIYANNFNGGLSDFIANREIKIPDPTIVRSLLEL